MKPDTPPLAPDVLQQALELGRVGVWEWDIETDEVRWNGILYDICGLDPGTERPGSDTFFRVVHPEDLPGLRAALQRALDEGSAYEYRHRIVRPDGGVRWLHARGRLAEGSRSTLRGVAVDVTALEEAARLRELNEFRARFLNVAAHELKTPLTPIRLQLQLLAMQLEGQSPRVQQSIAIMRRSLNRLDELVEDVLDAARIQATQLRLQLRPIDLGRTVQDAAEGFAQVASEVGIRFEQDLPAGIHIEGDPTRIVQVVNNLLSNAIKFTPRGGVVATRVDADGPDAVLHIRDTGRGLTREQLGQLFQPFVQVHEDAQATLRGTGLGLFIVKGIVEQHGGSIHFDSEGPDHGTEVTIRFPRTQATVRGAAVPAPPSTHVAGMAERLRQLV